MRTSAFALVAALGLFSATARAPGVTDAAIAGVTRSADSASAPVPAQITILNGSTGARLLLRTDERVAASRWRMQLGARAVRTAF